ncbi:MAG: hypothetical protein JRN67_04795 [Nitrososphaerota archaeon]|nr:hypothetical protein [Nitrososphaerota archaeon]
MLILLSNALSVAYLLLLTFLTVISVSGAIGGSFVVLVGVALTIGYSRVGYGLAALFSAFLVY